MTADLSAISAATDLGELAKSYGLKLRKHRNGFIAQCCFHSEKSASLHLHTAGKLKGKFRCFGCDANGDVLDFVQRLDSCDLPTAIRRLASDAGIVLTGKPLTPQERRQRERDRTEREIAAWWFREQWKEARRGLNRAMQVWAAGNPFAEDVAGIYSARLRWIERERGTTAGMAEFRASRTTERQYRDWLSSHLRQYAARLEFVALVLDSIPPSERRSKECNAAPSSVGTTA